VEFAVRALAFGVREPVLLHSLQSATHLRQVLRSAPLCDKRGRGGLDDQA
jgi:hypothetical protein